MKKILVTVGFLTAFAASAYAAQCTNCYKQADGSYRCASCVIK